jgi:hypothetical protein
MALIRRQFLAFVLIIPFGLSSVASADSVSKIGTRLAGYTVVNDPEVAHHLNSFAMIFGRCVWIPPSPKAALAGLGLFFGIGITTEPDTDAAEAIIASQYIVAGKSQSDADKEIAWLNSCFATYEAPPENSNHSDRTGRGAVIIGSEADR